MPRSASIPPRFHSDVLKCAGTGMSTTEIATWLGATHSVKTTSSSVKRFMRSVAESRAPIADAVVKEQLSKTLTIDLSSMDALLKRSVSTEAMCNKVFASASGGQGQDADPDLQIKAAEQMRRERAEQRSLLELRFRLSGAGGGDAKDDPKRPRGLVLLPAITPDE